MKKGISRAVLLSALLLLTLAAVFLLQCFLGGIFRIIELLEQR